MGGEDFIWLLSWYYSQCDGDWEHGSGIRIETLDNPGWSITINLEGTELADVKLNKIFSDRSENDWIYCSIKELKFEGRCGPTNFLEILKIFRNLAEKNSS